MKRSLLIASLGMVLLGGCYCKKYVRGYSSVRELKVAHTYWICPEPQGVTDGKSIFMTAYSADPFALERTFKKNFTEQLLTNVNFSNYKYYGLRAETFLQLGPFPGPLLGIGLDYSGNKISGRYETHMHQTPENQIQTISQQRLKASFNLVTWITDRMMGYIAYQPGMQWTKRNIQSEFSQYNLKENNFAGKFNQRIGYGFYFYFRPMKAFNIELGYGGGVFIKGGISIWVI